MLLDALNPQFAEAQQVAQGRQAPEDRARRVRLAAGLRQDARLPRAAGEADGQAARRAGRPREPRPQSAHRGRRAAPRAGRLHRLRARRAVPAGRLSRRRGQGARAVREARPGEDPRRLRRRGRLAEGAARRAPARSAWSASATAAAIANLLATRVPDLGGAVPFYGSAAEAGGRPQDQGAAAHPLRRERRAHQRRLAGLRGGAEGQQVSNTRRTRTPAPSTASTTTPPRATTRPPRPWPGNARSTSSTRTCGASPRGTRPCPA